ncbi:hypothetical protein AB0B50_34225 [Streptomyces sp. NPDC041068]|uniref:hypothetical protein n=1 Tax=Streptomyces sp. NPDC041068 TaxID=3155130 RepID=UPI0033CEE056
MVRSALNALTLKLDGEPAADRPGEAANLRSSSTPRVGSAWTDTGESYDSRGLKKRARKATRAVPIPPLPVRMIRDHIQKFGTAEGGRLFRAVQGGHILSKEYGEVWKADRCRRARGLGAEPDGFSQGHSRHLARHAEWTLASQASQPSGMRPHDCKCANIGALMVI